MEQAYELTKLRNTRFPQFYFITLISEGSLSQEIVCTRIACWNEPNFSGHKPEEISEFLHAKLCMVSAGIFQPELSTDERKTILETTQPYVQVGRVELMHAGKFTLSIDNQHEKLLLIKAE